MKKIFIFLLISQQLLNSIVCSLFSSSDVYISSKPVLLYSNGTTTDYSSDYIKGEDFKSGIIPFENLTQPSTPGLQGVLYDRGYSCQVHAPFGISPPLVTYLASKIALVKKGGGCNFYQKVYNSQLDGAVGVIIYDDIAFKDDDTSGSMKITKGNITITMYYVDLNIGKELLQMLQYTSAQPINTTSDNSTFQPVISLTMHPAVGGFPSAWEFTLIIVVALLAISFLASMGMHWHLWRIRRRQRSLFEDGLFDATNNTSAPKKVIDPRSLALFPIRIIGDEPMQRVESRASKAIENVETLIASPSNASTSQQIQDNSNLEDTCVICLDEFGLGDQVRKLPCDHEYHRECIDPWLTIKSASCPLCKHDCSTTAHIPETIITVPLPTYDQDSVIELPCRRKQSHSNN